MLAKGYTEKYLEESVQELHSLQSRIGELNEIILEIQEENFNLQKENFDIRAYHAITKCKYPPFSVSKFLLEGFDINISSRKIVKIAKNKDMFHNDNFVLRVPRVNEEDISENYTTVIFSFLGILQLERSIIQDNMPLFYRNPKRKYDFSEFVGKLEWNEDPLETQRKMREQW